MHAHDALPMPKISLEQRTLAEADMVGPEGWEKIHRRPSTGASIRPIAPAPELDRKTVRRRLRQPDWKPYHWPL